MTLMTIAAMIAMIVRRMMTMTLMTTEETIVTLTTTEETIVTLVTAAMTVMAAIVTKTTIMMTIDETDYLDDNDNTVTVMT